jgi:hypothetical protein
MAPFGLSELGQPTLIQDKKGHILVDTLGLPLQAILYAADIHDRDGGMLLSEHFVWPFSFSAEYKC